DHLRLASDALAPMGAVAAREPRFAGWALAVGEALQTGPLQVAISEGEGQHELAEVALALTSPGTLVVVGRAGASPALLEDRGPVDGQAAAYVCRGTTCDLPVTSVETLRHALA